MNKNLLFSFLLICISNLKAQELKTYSGNMQDAILDNGKASYTYYEKDGEMVRHGKFSYSWKDEQAIQVLDKKISVLLSKTISGNFKDGLKDGTWTYSVKYTDYPLNHNHGFGVSSDATYSSGSISMIANYKKGIPHGNWSYNQNFKTRYSIPIAYNTWKWSETSPIRTTKLTAQFNNGVLTGTFDYNNPFLKESANFSFDDRGVMNGNGTFVNLGSTTELTFKNGIRVKEVKKDMSSGKMTVKKDLASKLQDPSFEYKLDTTDITKFLDNKLDYFRQDRYFNYKTIAGKKELITGDEFRFKKIKGGIFYDVFECTSFEKSEAYGYELSKWGTWERKMNFKQYNHMELYQEAIEKNDFDEALKRLEIVKSFLGDNSWVCKDEKESNLKRVEKLISEVKVNKEKFYAKRAENLALNKIYFSDDFLDSLFGFQNEIIAQIVPEEQKENFLEFLNFYSKLDGSGNGEDEFKNIKILNEKIAHPFSDKDENTYKNVNMGTNGSGVTVYEKMLAYQYIWHVLNNKGRNNIPNKAWDWLNTITIGELRYLVHYMTVKSYTNFIKFCYSSRAKDEVCVSKIDNCNCYYDVRDNSDRNIATIKTIEEKDLEILSPVHSLAALNDVKDKTDKLKVESKVMFVEMFSEHKDNFKSKSNLKPKFKELNVFIQLLIDKIPEIQSNNEGIVKLFELSDALRSIQTLDEKLIKSEIDKTLKNLSTFKEKTELVLKYK